MHTQLYKLLYKELHKQSKVLAIESPTQTDEIRHTIRWVMRDNPDIFWFAHQYHYDETSSTIHFQYTFSAEKVKTIQQSINDVIDNDFCIEYVQTLTRQEQIVYVYKWLVSYCNYNANSAYNQSIYSVFVCRNSICTGYAKAAQYLFNLLGIESHLVFGRLHNDKEDGRHCWNLLKIDNQYYHFDVCFGDSILDNVAIRSGVQELFKVNGINYNFLCVSTDEILKSRSIEDITTLPECPTSWAKTLVKSLAQTMLKQREGVKGCLLHTGSSADIYLCSKDKNTVLKVFTQGYSRLLQSLTCLEEFRFMQQTQGCSHILQSNKQFTDLSQNIIAIEQSTPIVDLLCSHYYGFSLKELIKMATDIAKAWKECQERGILYRDIHICNIFRSNDGIFKLGDFGSCTKDFHKKETVGNQWFMAPETFVSGIFTEASAIYSISMVMYFILNNLRPVFWVSGCEDEALQKRMNGNDLPIPAGCINLPSHITEKLIQFFTNTSASSAKERINSITEFIYELEKLSYCCENHDYIIHHKGISFDLDLDTENNVRINTSCILEHEGTHKCIISGDVEQMCATMRRRIFDYTSDSASNDQYEESSSDSNWKDDLTISNDAEQMCTPRRRKIFDYTSDSASNDQYEESSSDSDWKDDLTINKGECNTITHSIACSIGYSISHSMGLGCSVGCSMSHSMSIDSDSTDISNSVNLTYESAFQYPTSHKEARITDIKIAYEKIITCLNQEKEQLEDVLSQINELQNKKAEVESQIKNPSPSKAPGFIRRLLLRRSIIEKRDDMVASAEESENTHPDILLECDKELKAKMYQAQMREKQIERFIQQKKDIEKELAILEEQNKYNEVYSSIFAPAEVKRKSRLQVQVYLHLYEEAEKVKSLAKESDKNAERRDYIPLSLKLEKGDKVDVEFNVYGETRLMSERKSVIWQGSFTKCSFDYFVPKDINVDELSCEANLFVNGAMIGEMRFITQIVDAPRNLNPEILSHRFNRIFISYAHQDAQKIKLLALAYKAQGVDYFYDRDSLAPGDIYEEKIFDYIDSSDLFVLCWSKNAAVSEYVAKEKGRALLRAYPQLSQKEATLKICPISAGSGINVPAVAQ